VAAATILDEVCLHRTLEDCTETVFQQDISELKGLGLLFTPELEAQFIASWKTIVEAMIRKYIVSFARRHLKGMPQGAPITRDDLPN
jgi:hypothetical protein